MKSLLTRRCVLAALAVTGCVVGAMAPGAAGLTVPAQQDPQDLVNRAKGQTALVEARVHMEAHRWRQAIDAFELALAYLPGSTDALKGLQE